MSAGVLAALALLLGAGSVRSNVQQPRATIAYASGGRIVTIAADGSGRQQLSGPPVQQVFEESGGDSGPQWSPDGSMIAFTRVTGGPTQSRARVYVMQADGSAQRELLDTSSGTDLGYPTWSPGGTELAVAEYVQSPGDNTTSSIVVVKLDGTVERTLARARFTKRLMPFLGEPAWSPDGSRIVFTKNTTDADENSTAALYVVGATGGTPRVLATNAVSADWSPDGSKIAFVGFHGQVTNCGESCMSTEDISVMNADGTGQLQLTHDHNASASGPHWSPDGQRIAFASDRNNPLSVDEFEVYSMRPDGSCITWLTNGSAISDAPDWRPGPGSSDPGGCGAVPRPPLIETQVPAAVQHRHPPVYWLGTSTDGMMLSRTVPGTSFAYDDCVFFDRTRCPAKVDVGTGPTCRSRLAFGPLGQAHAIRKQRGALMIWYATAGDSYLFTGTQAISVQAAYLRFGKRGERVVVRRVQRALRDLYRVSGETGPRPLAPPMIPRSVMRNVKRSSVLTAACTASKASAASWACHEPR